MMAETTRATSRIRDRLRQVPDEATVEPPFPEPEVEVDDLVLTDIEPETPT